MIICYLNNIHLKLHIKFLIDSLDKIKCLIKKKKSSFKKIIQKGEKIIIMFLDLVKTQHNIKLIKLTENLH